MGRPPGGWIAGAPSQAINNPRGVWSPRESYPLQAVSAWPTPPVADSLYNTQTQILWKFDSGVNGSTTLTDSSSYARTGGTITGAGSISTVRSRFGLSSLGATGIATSPTNAAFSLGTGDWCLEMWVWMVVVSGNILQVRDATTVGVLEATSFQLRNAAGTQLSNAGYNRTFPTLRWVHYALSRSGNVVSRYFDGTRDNTATITGQSIYSPSGSTYVVLGSTNAWIDEFRFTVGSPRYTGASYTIPTGPFATS